MTDPLSILDSFDELLRRSAGGPWEVEYCNKHDGFHLRSDEEGGIAVFNGDRYTAAQGFVRARNSAPEASALARAAVVFKDWQSAQNAESMFAALAAYLSAIEGNE